MFEVLIGDSTLEVLQKSPGSSAAASLDDRSHGRRDHLSHTSPMSQTESTLRGTGEHCRLESLGFVFFFFFCFICGKIDPDGAVTLLVMLQSLPQPQSFGSESWWFRGLCSPDISDPLDAAGPPIYCDTPCAPPRGLSLTSTGHGHCR